MEEKENTADLSITGIVSTCPHLKFGLDQWFPNFSMHENHQETSFNNWLLVPIPGIPDSVGLNYPNMFSGDGDSGDHTLRTFALDLILKSLGDFFFLILMPCELESWGYGPEHLFAFFKKTKLPKWLYGRARIGNSWSRDMVVKEDGWCIRFPRQLFQLLFTLSQG